MANDLREKESNPAQEDYDNKFGYSSSSGDATSTSGHDGSDSSENLSQNSAEQELAKSESRADSPDDVRSADKQAQEEGVGGGNLYDPSGASQHHKQPMKAMLKGAFAGRRKYGWIGGGIGTALIGAFLSFFPVLGPVHIMSNLTNFNFEYNDSFRRNRTGRIVRSVLAHNKNPTRNVKDTPFVLKADLVEFEAFENRIKSSGWNFEYNNDGKAIGLIDSSNNRIDLENTSRSEFKRRIQPVIDDAIPAWRFNKRARTRDLISTFTGPRRSFIWSKLFGRDRVSEPDFEVAKFKKETGLDQPDITRQIDVKDTEVDKDGNTIISDKDAAGGKATIEAQQAVIDAKLAGMSDADALAIGTAEVNKVSGKVRGGKTSVIFGTLIASCIAHSVYENQALFEFERYAAALRYGATFMLATNEIQQGSADIGEVGQFFSEYNNSQPKTVQVDTGSSVENVEYGGGSFASSAAWQRATGQEVTGQNINNEYRVNPDESNGGVVSGILGGMVDVIAGLGGAVSVLPFMGTVCKVVNSGLGIVVGYLFDAFEAFSVLAACFTGAGCAAVSKFALAEALFEAGSRILAASLTAFTGYLITHPEQALAVLDQSLNLINSEESRTGTPVKNTEYNQGVQAFLHEQNNNKSLEQRYFALDNPHSLVSGLSRAKINLSELNPINFIASIFGLPGKALVAVTNSQNVYAQADIEFDNYGFQKYSYDNTYMESDPFELAEEVQKLIDDDTDLYLNNGEDKTTGQSYARDFAVNCMGYIADQGTVNKTSSNDNFLPQFSDPELTDANRRNDAFHKICIVEAQNFSDIYSKIGRYVDDIELISSMIELTGQKVPSSGSSTSDSSAPGGDDSPVPVPNPPIICDPNKPMDEICITP